MATALRYKLLNSGLLTDEEWRALEQKRKFDKSWVSRWLTKHKDHFQQKEGAREMLGLNSELHEGSVSFKGYFHCEQKDEIIGAIQNGCARLHLNRYQADTSAIMKEIYNAVEKSPTIYYLSLHEAQHKPSMRPISIEDVNCLTNLKVLVLWNCKLDGTDMTCLSNGLLRNSRSQLKELILTRNNIGAKGFGAIVDAMISTSDGPQLECISVDQNRIGTLDDCLSNKLVEMFNRYMPLKRIHLEGNDFGNSICSVLARVKCFMLYDLTLGRNGIDNDGMASLAASLKVFVELEYLVLVENDITYEGYNAIANSIMERANTSTGISYPKLKLAIDMDEEDETHLEDLKRVPEQFLELTTGFKYHGRYREAVKFDEIGEYDKNYGSVGEEQGLVSHEDDEDLICQLIPLQQLEGDGILRSKALSK